MPNCFCHVTLGVGSSASRDEITKAFHRLSRRYAPDLNIASPSTDEIYKRITHADDVLTKPTERQRHLDKINRPGQAACPGTKAAPKVAPKSSASDKPPAGPKTPPRRGGSEFLSNKAIVISLAEMLLGVEKEHIFGRPEGPATQYKVKLPIKPSLAPNVLVRVRILKDGQPSTIAKIPVKLKNTSNFRLVGLDLACTIPVSPSEAACGATISFRHLFGDQVSLSLPIGARDQQIFTLAGLGAPGDLNERSGKPGDLKVKIKIRQPNPLSSRAKQLIHDLDAEMFPGGVRRHFKSV